MSYDEYNKAQKLALKAFRQNTVRGNYPYLPVLDEILTNDVIEQEQNLGVIDIPLKQVVGTATAGRTQAFASNFMPLLDYGNEFSAKWSRLIDAQISEGIHDPILVYEYMNKYYVVEGNKRTSVLKYMNCPTISAEVIRKVPRRSDDIENQIYYEFMDFYKDSKINYVIFSQLGSYQRLCDAVGIPVGQEWTEDERMDFSSFHAAFYGAYKAKGGNEFRNMTDDDALLFYLNLYPYETARNKLTGEIRPELDKIWPEITTLNQKEPVEILMTPTTETNILKKIQSPKVHKVAFVYDTPPEKSDWIYSHELAKEHIHSVFKGAIEAESFVAIPYETDEKLFTRLCQEGYDIIFAISPLFIRSCIKLAPQYPDVKILNCSLNSPHPSVRSYGIRIYEGKFLLGMLAGILTDTPNIGYIADYPIYGVIPGINAFALGAQSVNPKAKIHLRWSSTKEEDVESYFRDNGISYISSQNLITPNKKTRAFGLYHLQEDAPQNIATTIYHWGVFYEELINSIMRGSWKVEDKNQKAVNYWWGLSANVLDIICGSMVPENSAKLINFLKDSMTTGNFHPFYGPIRDQKGELRCKEKELMLPDDILNMDWLVYNVLGDIPTMEELDDHARGLVELRGLDITKEIGEGSIL